MRSEFPPSTRNPQSSAQALLKFMDHQAVPSIQHHQRSAPHFAGKTHDPVEDHLKTPHARRHFCRRAPRIFHHLARHPGKISQVDQCFMQTLRRQRPSPQAMSKPQALPNLVRPQALILFAKYRKKQPVSRFGRPKGVGKSRFKSRVHSKPRIKSDMFI